MSNEDQVEELKRIIEEERAAKEQRAKEQYQQKKEYFQEYNKTRRSRDQEHERYLRRKGTEGYERDKEYRKQYKQRPGVKEKEKEGTARRHALKREQQANRPRPNTCEVCSSPDNIMFDHSHASGKFRGWLCRRCNWVLGHVSDDPTLLEKLAVYLRTHDG